MKINARLIKQVKERRLRTDERQNLQTSFANAARARADRLHQRYIDFLASALRTSDFEVTNELCLAPGIVGHVYVPGSGPKGIGKRKCCFCGCDDFDF